MGSGGRVGRAVKTAVAQLAAKIAALDQQARQLADAVANTQEAGELHSALMGFSAQAGNSIALDPQVGFLDY